MERSIQCETVNKLSTNQITQYKVNSNTPPGTANENLCYNLKVTHLQHNVTKVNTCNTIPQLILDTCVKKNKLAQSIDLPKPIKTLCWYYYCEH